MQNEDLVKLGNCLTVNDSSIIASYYVFVQCGSNAHNAIFELSISQFGENGLF